MVGDDSADIGPGTPSTALPARRLSTPWASGDPVVRKGPGESRADRVTGGRVTAFVGLMAVAAAAAVLDWVAVGTATRPLEYGAKPAVLGALVVAAASLPADRLVSVDRRVWFVAALVGCLVGDVLLMLPQDRFVPGLAAFLAGHLLYIGGFLQPPVGAGPAFSWSGAGLAATLAVVVASEAVPAGLVLRALVDRGQRVLVAPVAVYMAAIVTMVTLACNSGSAVAATGAVLFLVSDTVLAVDRFVAPLRRGTLVVHITYHLAQGLLVLSLVR